MARHGSRGKHFAQTLTSPATRKNAVVALASGAALIVPTAAFAASVSDTQTDPSTTTTTEKAASVAPEFKVEAKADWTFSGIKVSPKLVKATMGTPKESDAKLQRVSLTAATADKSVDVKKTRLDATTAASLASARSITAEETKKIKEQAAEQARRLEFEQAQARENMAAAIADSAASQVSVQTLQPGEVSSERMAIVNFARRFAGTPYVYGGARPGAFDCSGFTSYVFAHFGIGLPHGADPQGRMGVTVPLSQALPGDLVVWPGHVGIYTGNGRHIAAHMPGVPLSETALYGGYRVVRILPAH